MSSNRWLVPVTSFRRATGSRRHELRSGRVGELRVAASVVPADAEAVADAVLDSVDGGIEVTAIVSAPWRGECRRCLKPVAGSLRSEVREMYRTRRPHEAPEADEDTYELHPDQLDLEPLVRDALLLELPLAPLCHEGCLGLCPTCGADLNEGPCPCPSPSGDPRWAVLNVLRAGPGDPPAGDRA
ncbi:MAG TPA: DUF177 domain-containing protein [Acidimicrobiales bacterium]|nr:DUF177 domain-containing protein [Acidimicrobiales bacterium]